MKGLLQRVLSAHVEVGGKVVGAIEQGLLVLIAVEPHDSRASADKLLHKLRHYRVFSDATGKMNRSVDDVEGGLLLVSQFTLAADTRSGLRPSFSSAAPPELAAQLFDYLLTQARTRAGQVAAGEFGADMHVHLINDGPVTFMLET